MDLKTAFDAFVSLMTSPDLQQELYPAKVIMIFFTFAFFTILMYFMFVSSYVKYRFFIDFQQFFKLEPAGLRKIARRWRSIKRRMDAGSEYEYKLAIMEAEDLFDDVLIEKGLAGGTFEERLSHVKKIQLPDPESVLDAHKVRNSVAHDPNYKISKDEAGKILDVFEKGIRSIESF